MSTCSSCGKRVAGTLRPCSQGCGIASYCNRKCQKAQHREHKKACQSACQAATKEKSGLVGSEPHIPREGLLNPSYVDFRTDVRREALKAHMHNKWLHVFDIYDRPLVLHYDSRVVVNPPTDVEYFVGVYLPMKPTEEDVLPFPRFERDDYYTRKLFSAFHTMTNGEKSLLRKDGRSLNSHTYFRSTNYQVGVHCFLEMRPDFSVQASHLTDTIIRSGKHPPVRWEPFDEWIYSSPNPKVRLKVAMTPLDIFFDPLTARRSSIYELLREAPELALCPSPGHKMEPGAPVEWFKTIFGVYQATEKLIYGDMRGPHKGWIRDPHASYSLTQIDSHADRRLCLYFDTVEEQFLIRPLHSEGFIFEDCPPDMTSLSLPPRGYLEGFDGKHPEMLVSNWKGYLRGEKEMIIPLILAPKECFISIRLQHKLWDGVREVGETEGVMGPAPRYETDDFEITEAVPQTPVAKKKKRKKRKKKKNGDGATVNPLMSTANIAMPSSPSDSNATTEKPNGGLKNPLPIHSIRCQEQVKDIPEAENIDRHKRRVEYPIAEDDNGRGKEEPPLYTKNKDQAVRTDIASKNEALDLKSMDRQERRAQSNEAHIIDAAAEEPCDAISIATRIDTICQWLQKELEDRAPQVETPTKELTWLCLNTEYCIGDVVFKLFDTKIRGFDKPLWLYAQESMTATILEKILSLGEDSKEGFEPARGWIRQNAMPLFEYCVENHRMMDMIALVGNRKAVPFVTEKMACQICGNLLESRGGSELGNKLAMAIPMIQLDSMQGGKLVKKCAANKLSKKAASALSNALRKGENALKKLQREAKKKGDSSGDFGTNSSSTAIEMRSTGIDKGEGAEQTGTHDVAQGDVSHYQRKIDSSMTWYVKLLEDCRHVDFRKAEKNNPESHTDEGGTESASPIAKQFAKSSKIVTSEQIAAAMARCSELPEDKAEEIISDVEMALDLSNWSIASEWIVEITEQAHKWFRKRSKKQNHMCERVARRLQLLSTGRWPYVLCKPVRTSSNSLSNLYESKIDSASRILWEVAISFSPRRSSGGKFFCEQVIRVWDIVEDHDNLTRAIARAVHRIEKSHIRGKECKIFSQLEDFDETSSQAINDIKQVVPKVFGMKQGIEGLESPQEGVYFAPANDDEKQFNLLKFYELNERAVELLLDEKADDMDLPFTPGPLEHEIIHYRTTPKRSILLMGRSGTGKTTCLVFRMWAQYMAYIDKNKGAKPRQLFLTKNDILRTEVEKSFNHMGLAWRNRGLTEVEEGGEVQDISSANNSSDTSIEFPLFLTSSEWLDLLDGELSGERFFSTDEIEQRKGSRDEDDAVHRGMEKFFSNDKTANTEQNNAARRQMTFGRFCDLWPKMKSRVKTTMDPALVWLEIKSHIKGCVSALRVNLCGNDRFLKRDEYLALPRKQSRIDRQLREVVYDLYLVYEQLKKGKFYDEMDIVFNLARRLPSDSNEVPKRMQGFLPVDAVFIDEVQDFTQSELYLITKLCSDPNNLMLAGDTAQSIAVGVGFRFTDVRQIFYNAFGGIEPKLLSLTHNYRSHSGILQLAASVVELLYFFFSDSLDRLPPDFGLFPGPKPVIMEVSSVADLVLMLDGSKRETSRIEFGAHQVVIVRNEEAKKALGDEFGVDKDWVMTVQESKGLEFDDVLLLNFFADSPAGDLWRAVSNYSIEDARKYRAECEVTSAPLQSFEWEEVEPTRRTRSLDFEPESHKILESELKMLYTAITRARVNVFIAEMETSACQPMFNYFRQRRLVDSVQKNRSTDLSGLRVFGQVNTVEEWRKRGEYYLRKAVGQKENVGSLRLAAKCFEKAGDTKKMHHSLAYLAFVQMEEHEHLVVKRRRQGNEREQRLYSIASRLLEAEDVDFLSKAGLCLVRTGPVEFERSAKIFEIYAHIHYARRFQTEESGEGKPSQHEQLHFSYAAKLYERCIASKHLARDEGHAFIVHAFRCFLFAGGEDDLDRASLLLENHSEYCKRIFLNLASVWQGRGMESTNPVFFMINDEQRKGSKDFKKVQKAMTKIARIACRWYHAQNDESGLSRAVNTIASREERIQLLSGLDADPETFLGKTIWGPSHAAFRDESTTGKRIAPTVPKTVDVTKLLCNQLLKDGDLDGAANILEERGRLLEAADWLSEKSEDVNVVRVFDLRALFVELALGCSKGKSKQEKKVLSSLLTSQKADFDTLKETLPSDTRISFEISWAKNSKTVTELLHLVDMAKSYHILWYLQSLEVALDKLDPPSIFERHSKDIWAQQLFFGGKCRDLQHLAEALSRKTYQRNDEDATLVSQVHSFFRLEPYPFDPSLVSTKVVTNWKLRTALKAVHEELPASSTFASNSLTVHVGKSSIDAMLASYCCYLGFLLLSKFEKYLAQKSGHFEVCKYLVRGLKCNCKKKHHKSSNVALSERVNYLQALISCLDQLQSFARLGGNCSRKQSSLWKKRLEEAKKRQRSFAEQVVNLIHDSTNVPVLISEYECGTSNPDFLIIRRGVVSNVLYEFALEQWHYLPRQQKKTDLLQTIRLWRVLDICLTNESECQNVLDQKLKREEGDLKSAQKDFDEKRMEHFIRNKTKIANYHVKSAQLFSRFWIWAVESVQDNLFNSITLTERLLKLTHEKQALKTLPQAEQLNLLETICVGLFSLISFRYSENSTGELWLALPEKGYMQCFLGLGANGSRTLGRGFGICLIETLEVCGKGGHFFHFFEKFVFRLETLASLIIRANLLSISSFAESSEICPDDIKSFERTVVLSSCILYNAMMLSNSGTILTKQEALNSPNVLPRLPLGGNIRALFIELRDSLAGLTQISSLPLHLRETSGKLNKHSHMVDLFQVTRLILNTTLLDRFSLFRIYRETEKIDIVQDNRSDAFEVLLQSCKDLGATPTDKSSNTGGWIPLKKHTTEVDSLDLIFGSDPTPCQEFLQGVDCHSLVEDTNQEADEMNGFSRKSDERDAATVIQNFLRRRNSSSYFRNWKETMTYFSLVVFAKIEARKRRNLRDIKVVNVHVENQYPLTTFRNLWNDLRLVSDSKNSWKKFIEDLMPYFDGAECQYCRIPLDPVIWQNRMTWCQINHPNLPYKLAAQQFNLSFYKTQTLAWQNTSIHPLYDHHVATELVIKLMNELPMLFCRLEISIKMLEHVIQVCQQEAEDGGLFTSWYLDCKEESLLLYNQMNQLFLAMRNQYVCHQFYELDRSMDMYREQSLVTQVFLAKKKEEEKQMVDQQTRDLEEGSDAGEEDGYDLVPLPSGLL